ncbi:hypothetical protein [Spirosoma montaniterrae]|uniref:Uncharacterized protein n=1 Tax=Spirosoma montaniterrae TaxID=1178516 RepID=A0A1P9X0A8_9BACT|nr:hypothetical protein [Spirosoma montaniterrae]AQG81066.1 hypothetical protein AWR27_18115 [Spirosoma montaniterrae]
MTFLRIILTICLPGALALPVSAQTVVKSMQTVNDGKTLSVNVVGTRDGRSFRHNLQFDVAGMTKAGRDSLYQQMLRSLDALDIRHVPGMPKPGVDAESGEPGAEVTFRCETCAGKGRLEVYGDNYLMTRSFNPKRDEESRFPLTVRLNPGEYRYKYWQNGVLQMELPFTVNAGEANEVKVK